MVSWGWPETRAGASGKVEFRADSRYTLVGVNLAAQLSSFAWPGTTVLLAGGCDTLWVEPDDSLWRPVCSNSWLPTVMKFLALGF